jgi:hypothetical protein
LYVKYFDHKGNKHEKDIFREVLTKHQSNRFAGYGPFLIALVNSIHFVEKSAQSKGHLKEVIEEDRYFKVLDQAVQNYLQATLKEFKIQGSRFNKAEFLLVVNDLPSNSKRVYYSPGYFSVK